MAPAPEKPTHREIPMKVLNLGLCRTGTTSTRQALLQLGYENVHHMQTVGKGAPWEPEMWTRAFDGKFGGIGKPFGKEEWDILLSRYDAVTDMPSSFFPDDLMDAYPDAKLILTVRDNPEAWMKSIKDTLLKMHELMFGSSFNPARTLMTEFTPLGNWVAVPKLCFKYSQLGRWDEGEAANRRYYEEHNENVKRLAKERGRELLVFNVKEGWGPLCAFLEKEVPEGDYPRVNETKDMQRHLKKIGNMYTIVNTIVYAGTAAAVAGLGWYLRKRRVL